MKAKITEEDFKAWRKIERIIGKAHCLPCPIAYYMGDENACDLRDTKDCPLFKISKQVEKKEGK